MIANPDKFKAIIIYKDRRDMSGTKLTINNAEILPEKEVTLLGIDIDNRLSFDDYISTICKKNGKYFKCARTRKQIYCWPEKMIFCGKYLYCLILTIAH